MNLKDELNLILKSDQKTEDKLQTICDTLDKNVPHFNWTGFYFAEKDKDELVLGPFTGAPTDHIRIPFGKGICGQVAVSGNTLEVPDVNAEGNYLSCSIDTKAEIVVPIFKEGKNIGQIDIDSHYIDPFTEEDKELLGWLADELSVIL